ncbi:hypothetical protein [Burkholderia pseudomallei]|uniref:hypothetical protein n=1 Tax=Burkholderia pseudomallei TaxID=28450 RepID=UPI00313FFA4B
MTAKSRWALVLAVGATATALSLSILAGWQRGGSLSERAVWVVIGMVLVTSAHVLPALLRDAPILVRGIGSLLWVACLVTACYGHAVFFILAQQHAGEQRASVVTIAPPAPGRNLTVVMADRAAVVRQLAWIDARRCSRDCAGLDARRVTLAAKLDVLNAEADDVRRIEVERARVTAQRDALLVDPVTSRLSVLLGMTTARVDLLSGLMFAVVLEGVACLLWTVALQPSSLPAAAAAVTDTTSTAVMPPQQPREGATGVTLPEVTPVTNVSTVTRPAVKAVAASHADGTVSSGAQSESRAVTENSLAPRDDPITPLPDSAPPGGEVTQLAQAIAAGLLRPTVAEIRRHVGCSQARAAALRRQLVERSTTA